MFGVKRNKAIWHFTNPSCNLVEAEGGEKLIAPPTAFATTLPHQTTAPTRCFRWPNFTVPGPRNSAPEVSEVVTFHWTWVLKKTPAEEVTAAMMMSSASAEMGLGLEFTVQLQKIPVHVNWFAFCQSFIYRGDKALAASEVIVQSVPRCADNAGEKLDDSSEPFDKILDQLCSSIWMLWVIYNPVILSMGSALQLLDSFSWIPEIHAQSVRQWSERNRGLLPFLIQEPTKWQISSHFSLNPHEHMLGNKLDKEIYIPG